MDKSQFRLYEHPWWSLLAVVFTSIFSIVLAGAVFFGTIGWPDDSPSAQFVVGISYHILSGFILAPFVLRLPYGKRTFRQYLKDIGFSRIQPFFQLVFLALSCYLILALSQAGASFVYRLFEGKPINCNFTRQVFNLSGDLPPGSASLLTSIPSMFEEVAFRGIALTVFLNVYSERKSILFSAMGFGMIHLLNLSVGRELVWVMGQVVWAFCIGLFYGYIFVRTGSLMPSMIVHFLGNAFIGSLSGYMQATAPIEIQALYGILFSLGIIPTTLMILWTKVYTSRMKHGDKLPPNWRDPQPIPGPG